MTKSPCHVPAAFSATKTTARSTGTSQHPASLGLFFESGRQYYVEGIPGIVG
ncbi:hypothetical protein [[Clostridium] scindens]|uniref:hypothetical protein n=1 Tax=Clostridium scindens (strain JCM 10418 / VPI 12708) TaxID=29347 RepID=UPI001C6FF61A|nr:hypothetical protein [[Clostridium] scindens]QYX26286.1 hypothetical protein K0036_14505 [[Clostridium] scindens]